MLGIRAYRPFPVEALRDKLAGRRLALVFDKALSATATTARSATTCAPPCAAARTRPRCSARSCGLGGRDSLADDLADAVRRAVADRLAPACATVPTDWLNLQL